MLWKILEAAVAIYAVLFVLAFPLVLALCKGNSPYSRQEEFEAFTRWEARKLEDEKALYRH